MLLARPPPVRLPPDSVESVGRAEYAMSEGSSPRGDASSETSGFTSTSVMTEASTVPQPAAEFPIDRYDSMPYTVINSSGNKDL